MNAVEAALSRCIRDAHGQLKLSWLWADPRKACNQLSAIIKRGKLSDRVTILRGGKGIFAPEDVARQVAGLIQPELLWIAPDAAPAHDVVVSGVGPEQEMTISSSTADAADLGQRLSTLLGHPVNFQLRATPDNRPALIDITMIFTGLGNNLAARQVRRTLAEFPEVTPDRSNFRFPGRGQRPIDVAPLASAIDFAFLLPGKAAAQMRRHKAARVIVQYLGGNAALVDEVISKRCTQETLRERPHGDNMSREVSDGEADGSPDTTDLGQQLSTLLGHSVAFQLRATPNKWPALVDITMIFTGLNVNHAGFAVRRLLTQYPELHSSIVQFKFPGRGQRPLSVVPLAVALDFAFLLPGKAAADMRRKAAALMVRYLGGDVTLVDEVYTNRRAQESLAAIPAEQRTPLEQVVRMCGEAVEAAAAPAAVSLPSGPDVLRIHAPPIIMEACPTGCLDGGPPHFYILGIPGQATSSDGETGMVYRGGRTKDFDARLAEHRKTYGNGVHMELCAPKYGHVETLWHRQIRPYAVTSEPREERILASKMELSRVPDFIVELHKIRQANLQLENLSQATPKKRTREEAEDELTIAEIDAKRERLTLETEARRVEMEAQRVETEAKRERLALETDIYRQREQFILKMAQDGHADAIRSLLAPRSPP